MKIIFDYNRTLFNPDTDSLYQGVFELLKDISKNNELFLISRNEPRRKSRLEELGIKKLFKRIAFVEEKTSEIFRDLADDEGTVLVIGDRVRDEIFLGNKLGFVTIWVRQGKFSSEIPISDQEKPRHTISDVSELRNIISKYEK